MSDNGWRFIAWWFAYGVVDALGEWAYFLSRPPGYSREAPEWFSALVGLTVFIVLWVYVIKRQVPQ
mgnify:CR=1 FL=1